jgi:hypothetical protein
VRIACRTRAFSYARMAQWDRNQVKAGPNHGVVRVAQFANLGSREQSDPGEGARALPRQPAWIAAIGWSPLHSSASPGLENECDRASVIVWANALVAKHASRAVAADDSLPP